MAASAAATEAGAGGGGGGASSSGNPAESNFNKFISEVLYSQAVTCCNNSAVYSCQ